MKVKINNEVLKWARESVNLSIDDVIKKLDRAKFTKDDLIKLESGEDFPEMNIARELAKMYGINLAVLYLPHIPKNIQPKINDFRQITNKLSKNAVFLIRKLVSNQKWIREYLISNDYQELDFVNIISIKNKSVNEAVEIIKNKLKINIDYNKSSEHNFDKARKILENQNVFVAVANSYNCHHAYKVDVKEIRGFAIADKIAPFIFINSSDSDNAKLFTLIHELTHILVGETGISNISLENIKDQNSIEIYCNEVASELLMPKDIFKEYWEDLEIQNIEKKISYISNKFPVSKLSILVKAKSFEYISDKEFYTLFNNFSKVVNKKSNDTGRPNPIYIKRNLNTIKFSSYVIEAYHDSNITLRDACNLLSIKSSSFQKYCTGAIHIAFKYSLIF